MVWVSSVWLCLCVCWPLVTVTVSEEDLAEGAACKRVNGTDGICKLLLECKKAVEEIKLTRKYPQICGFKGDNPLVCCDLDRKSVQKCKEYAESVFLRVPDLIEDGYITYDTCNTVSRNTTRTKRVANGVESLTREFPHMALIGYIDVEGERTGSKNWRCSGSLISNRFVLTAAFCVVGTRKSGPPRLVRLGDHNIRSDVDEDEDIAQPTEYSITKTFIHPEYDYIGTKYNDIALLKLNTTVYFTEFIRPICLHTEHRLPSSHALVTGWGNLATNKSADILQTLNLNIISNEVCNEYYKNVQRRDVILKNGIVDDIMVCAGDIEQHKDSCYGDGGGPLQVPLEDPYCMYSQVGIISSGPSTCGHKAPGVYTRVSYYLTWIENIVWN